MKPSIDDAPSQVIHSLPLYDVLQHYLTSFAQCMATLNKAGGSCIYIQINLLEIQSCCLPNSSPIPVAIVLAVFPAQALFL